MSNMAIGNFLTVADAAAELGMTEGRIRQLLRAGELRGEHLNGDTAGAWLIYRASVEKHKKKPRVTGRPRVSEQNS